uniref:Uncharacterized protein n=1 Tax=Cucumis melo TaxID=3656 RepID=A0A9I9E8A4_CUCME
MANFMGFVRRTNKIVDQRVARVTIHSRKCQRSPIDIDTSITRNPKISSSSNRRRCLPLANRRAAAVAKPCTSVSRRRRRRLRQRIVGRQNSSRSA